MKEVHRQNEDLKFELDRIQMQLQKANHDKEQTQELRREDTNALEATQHKIDR